MFERGGADAVRGLPGGEGWLSTIESLPAADRHLATHEGHLVHLTDRDRAAVTKGAELLGPFTLTGTPAALRNRVAELAAGGVTEVVYQPAGADIPGELDRFFAAVA